MARLLVVDDERDIRQLYAAELQDEGYQVETAGSAAEAAELLQQGGFDLMVLDIQMKGESGLQLLQRLVHEEYKVPVVLCTAFGCYQDDFSSWLAASYVVKSGDLGELKKEVRRVLEKHDK